MPVGVLDDDYEGRNGVQVRCRCSYATVLKFERDGRSSTIGTLHLKAQFGDCLMDKSLAYFLKWQEAFSLVEIHACLSAIHLQSFLMAHIIR